MSLDFVIIKKGDIVDIIMQKTLLIFLNIPTFSRSQNVKSLNLKSLRKQVFSYKYHSILLNHLRYE